MNNYEEYNDCKTQLEQIWKINANGIKIRSKCEWYEHGKKIFVILSKPRKKAVLFKAKFEQLFIMTKKQTMKQKLIIIFIIFSVICIKKTILF